MKINQTERLKLFDTPTGYEEKFIDDKWYVKSFNGGTKKWQVAIYSIDAYKRYKGYSTPSKGITEPWRCVFCNDVMGVNRNIHTCRLFTKTLPVKTT